MDMRNSLSRDRTVVQSNREAVGFQVLFYESGGLPHSVKKRSGLIACHIDYRFRVPFRYHHRMTDGNRVDIEKCPRGLILENRFRRNIPGTDFAENAVHETAN